MLQDMCDVLNYLIYLFIGGNGVGWMLMMGHSTCPSFPWHFMGWAGSKYTLNIYEIFTRESKTSQQAQGL